jgi:hypothetical protein
MYLNNEVDVLAGSYFFFDAVPADIESIKVIDNTKYRGLKAYDDNNNEINISIYNRGVIRNSGQHYRTGAWFPYYHIVLELDLSNYLVFSNDQLDRYKEDDIYTNHCFINCMNYYRLDEDIIEFAKDIIKDVLPLKYLDKICRELNITCDVSFVDNTGNQHTAKKYGIGNSNIKLILMYDHFMPNVIIDKLYIPSNLKINRNIILSSLIAHMIRKNLFIALPMKYCHTDVNTNMSKINDYNCKLIKDNKTYGKYKDSYELINNLLLGSYSYHGRLKQ